MSKMAPRKPAPPSKTAGGKADAKKDQPGKDAGNIKAESVLGIVPKKNPYAEMMITAEKIKTEKKTETKNVKTDFSFNPKNCIFIEIILCP